jgi:phosphate transport system substrate-binding protein
MNMGNMMRNYLILSLLAFGLSSCFLFSSKEAPKDGPAQGEIAIAVDESFQPLVQAEKTAFENNYHFAKLSLRFTPENEAVADLLNEKVRSIVVSRDLTAKEQEIFTREKITYRSFRFAADGVALLTHMANNDTLITLPALKGLLEGRITDWASIGSKSTKGEVVLVVDKANSSNIKFLIDRLGISASQTLRVFAAGSNPKVIDYVKQHKNAIGIIGSNWISDGDNPTSLGFIRSVHVMSVAEKEGLDKSKYTQPFGYNLALKTYPLRREIKMILKESHLGLGTGFVNYVCGEMGQLIVLKAGLIPLTRPITIRTYQINQ